MHRLVHWRGDISACVRFQIVAARIRHGSCYDHEYRLCTRKPFDITREFREWSEVGIFSSRREAHEEADRILRKHLGYSENSRGD